MVAALGRPLADDARRLAARAGAGRAGDHRHARAPRAPAPAAGRLALTSATARRFPASAKAPTERHVCPWLAYRLRADESDLCRVRPARHGGARRVPAPASAALRSFRSPTGKLGCTFYSDPDVEPQVRCEWRRRQRPRRGARRDRRRASGSRSRDTVLDPKAKVLKYGKSTKFGRLTLHVAHVPASRAGAPSLATASWSPSTSSGCSEPWLTRQWVYDFAEGSQGDARPARRQGRQRRRDDARARRRARARRLHDHDRGLRRLHAGRPAGAGRASAEQVAEALARLRGARPASGSATPRTRCWSRSAPARASRCRGCSTPSSTSASTTRSVEGLARATGNERFAWDSYRRFVQMFGNVVPRRSPGERFEEAISERQGRRAASSSTPSSTSTRCKELTDRFKALYREHTGEDFPQDPQEQLRQAIRAVFDSWTGERAVDVPPHQPHPRRLGHRGQRPADGLRQQGRHARAPASPSAATR